MTRSFGRTWPRPSLPLLFPYFKEVLHTHSQRKNLFGQIEFRDSAISVARVFEINRPQLSKNSNVNLKKSSKWPKKMFLDNLLYILKVVIVNNFFYVIAREIIVGSKNVWHFIFIGERIEIVLVKNISTFKGGKGKRCLKIGRGKERVRFFRTFSRSGCPRGQRHEWIFSLVSDTGRARSYLLIFDGETKKVNVKKKRLERKTGC